MSHPGQKIRQGSRLKGIALSAFVKSGPYQPAVKGVESCHVYALSVFAGLLLIQLIPRALFLPTQTAMDQLLETAAFAVANVAMLTLCAFWFWLYFADRKTEYVRVRPLCFGRPQDVILALPEIHSSQFILLVLPLMLASLVALSAAFLAQLGFLSAALVDAAPAHALLAQSVASEECTGFGDASHRALLAVFATVLGNDHPCIKLSSATALGAYLLLSLWVARALLAAIAFGVFVQFGTVIVKRRRG